MDFREEMTARTAQVEQSIIKYLPEESGFQKTVMEAMNYSFLAGGKRLRPMLMLETYRLFWDILNAEVAGQNSYSEAIEKGRDYLPSENKQTKRFDVSENRREAASMEEAPNRIEMKSRLFRYGTLPCIVEPFMAALEMIHTYSLIHDDLPAMDNDEYRRGRKTTHVVYGEAMAILAGDALLNFAFETAMKAWELEPGNERVGRALQILAHNAGIYGMLGGQVVDVESEGQPLSREKLDFIYDLKTGALIEAAMQIGAVLAGADEEQLALVSRVAKEVGLAFQIQDDILDVVGDASVLGKPIGSDEKNQKTTYVTIRGLEQSARDVERLSERAIETLAALPAQNEFLNQLLHWLVHRDR